jgi:hypothetical protein
MPLLRSAVATISLHSKLDYTSCPTFTKYSAPLYSQFHFISAGLSPTLLYPTLYSNRSMSCNFCGVTLLDLSTYFHQPTLQHVSVQVSPRRSRASRSNGICCKLIIRRNIYLFSEKKKHTQNTTRKSASGPPDKFKDNASSEDTTAPFRILYSSFLQNQSVIPCCRHSLSYISYTRRR